MFVGISVEVVAASVEYVDFSCVVFIICVVSDGVVNTEIEFAELISMR